MLVSGASLGYSTVQQYINQAQNAAITARRNAEAKIGENPARVTGYPEPSYIFANRGIMVQKGLEADSQHFLVFQFNPETISDTKAVNMSSKSYLGFSNVDYIWSSGSDRVISFKLNFEATAGMNTPNLGGENTYGNIDYDNLDKQFPRGTLDFTEKLQAYQYPRNPDPNKPIFANGGHIPAPKFMPPPIVVFAHGNYYLEGVVGEVTVNHTLFNNQLIPVRSECDVQFKVLEGMQVQVKNLLDARRPGNGSGAPLPPIDYGPSTNPDELAFT